MGEARQQMTSRVCDDYGKDVSAATAPSTSNNTTACMFSWRRRIALILIVVLAALNLAQFYYIELHPSSTGQRLSLGSLRRPWAGTGSKETTVPEKAVVLASFSRQNVDWTARLPASWRVYRYVNDDPTPMAHGSPEGNAKASIQESVFNYTLTTPNRRGREAMAYLTFIIDHYHELPAFSVFLHGHERTWHQIERSDDKIRALNFTAITMDGYANIRCTEVPQCLPGHELDLTQGPDNIKWAALKALPDFWRLIFPLGPPLPSKLGSIGTAQFVVSRDAIRARPLEFWRGLRRPLERDVGEMEKLLPELKKAVDELHMDTSYVLGLLYEKIWHVIFGKPGYHCFGEAYCREVTFSNAIACDRYIGLYQESKGWENITYRVDEDAIKRAAATQARALEKASRRGTTT